MYMIPGTCVQYATAVKKLLLSPGVGFISPPILAWMLESSFLLCQLYMVRARSVYVPVVMHSWRRCTWYLVHTFIHPPASFACWAGSPVSSHDSKRCWVLTAYTSTTVFTCNPTPLGGCSMVDISTVGVVPVPDKSAPEKSRGELSERHRRVVRYWHPFGRRAIELRNRPREVWHLSSSRVEIEE